MKSSLFEISTLPMWQSHKVVKAGKIALIIPSGPDLFGDAPKATKLVLQQGHQVTVSEEYMLKHKPQVGGYFVMDEDGYQSWSPKESFEQGYTSIVLAENT